MNDNLTAGRIVGTKYKPRRAYKYSYDDVGSIVGKNGKSCRQWMANHNLKLDKDNPSESLKAVILYVSRMTPSKSPIMLIPKKTTPKPDKKLYMENGASVTFKDYGGAKIESKSMIRNMERDIGSIEESNRQGGPSPAMAKMLNILATAEADKGNDSTVDPRVELKKREDRYRALFMQGACHGEYYDYTPEESEEMDELKSWLNKKGVQV